ncbi:hypothetical protein BDN72DRAFT_962235 [Pluteus cervinus]|uniref:Uncharacterized protein n=1 Tax=Pluteus cervinus TaxID=181527 RepID=A0ACD3AK20_9AGAR|nr:hypothetical protein BDN72DRAFT_962235 [Pluteus cervinus]
MQLVVMDLISLSHTSRDVQLVVFPLVLAAPSWFYQAYPTLSIDYTFHFRVGFGTVIRHLLRLKDIFRRVKALERLSLDFTELTIWFRQESIAAFDKALSGVLMLAAKKGCTELEVELRNPHYYCHVPLALKLKRVAKSLMHSFVRETPRFKLTKVDTARSPGFPLDAYGRVTFLTIINSSTTLTSLSLDLNRERRDTLSSIKAPSLQSFALKDEYLDGKVFGSFLSQHHNIKVLNVCGKVNSLPTKRGSEDLPRGLSVELVCLEQLLCSTELLSYLLQNLDRCLPNLTEVTVTRLVPSSPYSTLNRELEKIRSQLDGIPLFGLRTYLNRGIVLRDFQDADLVRKYVTRLEFEVYPWTEPSHLDQWSMFPNVNYIKVSAVRNYINPDLRRPLPSEKFRSRIAQYPGGVKVVVEDNVEGRNVL